MAYPSQYFNRIELWKRTLLKYDRQITHLHVPKVLKENGKKKFPLKSTPFSDIRAIKKTFVTPNHKNEKKNMLKIALYFQNFLAHYFIIED